MLGSNGYPEAPNDLGSLGRRLVQLERLVELTGGQRALTKASIGRGGLRVLRDGDIRIEDGGSLIIQTGNLVLGEGKIDGSALKSQLEPRSYTQIETGVGLTTSWSNAALVSITAPGWASSTLVQTFSISSIRTSAPSGAPASNLSTAMRNVIASQGSLDINCSVLEVNGVTLAAGSVSSSRTVDTSATKTFTVAAQARSLAAGTAPANPNSRVDLYVTALFFR